MTSDKETSGHSGETEQLFRRPKSFTNGQDRSAPSSGAGSDALFEDSESSADAGYDPENDVLASFLTERAFFRKPSDVQEQIARIPDPNAPITVSIGAGQHGVDSFLWETTKAEFIATLLCTKIGLADKLKGYWFIPGVVMPWTAEEVEKWNDKKAKVEDKKPASKRKGFKRRKAGRRYRDRDHIAALYEIAVDLDCDDGTLTFEFLCEQVALLGLEAVIYTSHSHMDGNKRRFRVIFFLREPWRKEQGVVDLRAAYSVVWGWLSKIPGAKPDTQCKNASRILYTSAAPKERAKYANAKYIPGKPLSWDQLVDLHGPYHLWDLITSELREVLLSETTEDKWQIACPNAEAHSDGNPAGAFLSRELKKDVGYIECQHAHCRHLDHLGFIRLWMAQGKLTLEQLNKYDVTKPRTVVVGREMEVADNLHAALRPLGLFYRRDDQILKVDFSEPDIEEQVTLLDKTGFFNAVHRLVDTGHYVEEEGQGWSWRPADTKPGIREPVFDEITRLLPKVEKVQYCYTPGYEQRGYYPDLKLLQLEARPDNPPTFTLDEAKRYIEEDILGDFPFESEMDQHAAVGMLCTTLVSKQLNLVPGFMTTGRAPQSGKTTLGKLAAYVAAGVTSAVKPWSKGEEAIAKELFSAMNSEDRSMLIFDNLPVGHVITSPTLNAAMTGEKLKTRKFHAQYDIKAAVDIVINLTGNNITLDAELATRFIRIGFTQTRANMAQRKFRQRDYMERFIPDERMGIMEALYVILTAGNNSAEVGRVRFPMWTKLVLEPMMKAGYSDFASYSYEKNQLSDRESLIIALFENIKAEIDSVEPKFNRYKVSAAPAGYLISKFREIKEPLFREKLKETEVEDKDSNADDFTVYSAVLELVREYLNTKSDVERNLARSFGLYLSSQLVDTIHGGLKLIALPERESDPSKGYRYLVYPVDEEGNRLEPDPAAGDTPKLQRR